MGDFARMTHDAWTEEEVFDNFVQMNRPRYGIFDRELERERQKEKWERRIRGDEIRGWWTTSSNNSRKTVRFKDMTPMHAKNIYNMLKRVHMYIPQYIRNYVEYGKQDFLNATITKDSMWRFSVLLLEKATTCKTCPMAELDWYEDDEGSYGSGRYQCSQTKEDIHYQRDNEMRGFRCPLKEVM